ncbi:hypothetical protein YTXLTZUM_CDS0198 [Enterococcus phage VRE9_3]
MSGILVKYFTIVYSCDWSSPSLPNATIYEYMFMCTSVQLFKYV